MFSPFSLLLVPVSEWSSSTEASSIRCSLVLVLPSFGNAAPSGEGLLGTDPDTFAEAEAWKEENDKRPRLRDFGGSNEPRVLALALWEPPVPFIFGGGGMLNRCGGIGRCVAGIYNQK